MNFNFETIGYKNSSAHEHLSKKYSIFIRFMAKNDVKGFDIMESSVNNQNRQRNMASSDLDHSCWYFLL